MLFYGLDIGSTNTKAVLLDSDGRILDHVSIPSRPQADRSNEAAIWLEHFCQALEYCASKGHLAGREVVCSVTAQGGSFIMLNANFEPLRTYHWTENAARSTVADLINLFNEQSYYHITGWQADSWLAAFKVKRASGRWPIAEG